MDPLNENTCMRRDPRFFFPPPGVESDPGAEGWEEPHPAGADAPGGGGAQPLGGPRPRGHAGQRLHADLPLQAPLFYLLVVGEEEEEGGKKM